MVDINGNRQVRSGTSTPSCTLAILAQEESVRLMPPKRQAPWPRDAVRRAMVAWVDSKLMPQVRKACIEWLDNDFMKEIDCASARALSTGPMTKAGLIATNSKI